MFTGRWKLALILIIAVGSSYWALEKLSHDITKPSKLAHYPDHYLENFTTLTMDQDGIPKNRLNARYMAHYSDNNTSELHKPEFELFRQDRPPIIVNADKGWVTSNNEVILLTGNVYLHQNDEFGERKFEVITEDVRILLDQNYVETDKPVTLINKRSVVNAIGMRAYLQEERMEFLSNVQITIEPRQTP